MSRRKPYNVAFLRTQHRSNLVSHGFVDCADWVSCEMGVFLGGGAFGMAQKSVNDWQGCPRRLRIHLQMSVASRGYALPSKAQLCRSADMASSS
jgi:hypothetical protein